MLPSGFISSHSTPAGWHPASSARSTAASVCPCRSSTPPAFATSGNTCPGLTISLRSSVERSLKRLRTDFLDIVLVHSDGNDLDIIDRLRFYSSMAIFSELGVAIPRNHASLNWSRSIPIESARRKSALVSHFRISGSAS